MAYTDAELAFLRERKTMQRDELHRLFVERFGRNVTLASLRSVMVRNRFLAGEDGKRRLREAGIRSGRRYEPLKLDEAVGRERVEKLYGEPTVFLCIEGEDPVRGTPFKWVRKHRYLWEADHGPIPAGMVLKCKGDRLNCDPANWDMVPRSMLGSLQRHHRYDTAPVELKPTIMAVTKLKHRIREIET